MIISCGRKSVIPSIYLKKNSNKKIINIHIQDPKVDLNNFSYVIAPEHDGLDGLKCLFIQKGPCIILQKKLLIITLNYLKSNQK